MQAFQIVYRNTQGTLMRILTAVSRRALDIHYVLAQAEPDDKTFKVSLLLDVNTKQVAQLRRDWFAIMDVEDVRIASPESIGDHAAAWPSTGRPPASTTRSAEDVSRAAMA